MEEYPTTLCPDLWECRFRYLPVGIGGAFVYNDRVYIPNTYHNYYAIWQYCLATKEEDLYRNYKRVYNFLLGYHKCASSPYGVCIYDMQSNMKDDACVICGLPDERK
jgi:hypothetical protein